MTNAGREVCWRIVCRIFWGCQLLRTKEVLLNPLRSSRRFWLKIKTLISRSWGSWNSGPRWWIRRIGSWMGKPQTLTSTWWRQGFKGSGESTRPRRFSQGTSLHTKATTTPFKYLMKVYNCMVILFLRGTILTSHICRIAKTPLNSQLSETRYTNQWSKQSKTSNCKNGTSWSKWLRNQLKIIQAPKTYWRN